MERNPNDFDEVVMNELFGKKEEKSYDPNDEIAEILGEEPLRYYDPLKPIIDKNNLKIEDSVFGDFFDDTHTFI